MVLQEVGFNLEGVARDGSVAAEPGPPVPAAGLVDVNSANPLVVKSWLAARLDFSPPVVALPASAYALLGGRVDVIQNRTVATVVYKSDKDLITLFCWPPKKEQLPQREYVIDGYHVHIWSNAECNYILISKLRGPEMDEFADSFRDQLQSGAYF